MAVIVSCKTSKLSIQQEMAIVVEIKYANFVTRSQVVFFAEID